MGQPQSHSRFGDSPHAVVLCVDDHELGLKTRKLLLQMEGYAVITALTATEGLRAFKQAEVDLVITDYYLPDQLGSALAEKMKSLRPGVPILLLSGSVEMPEGLGGADAFLSKATDPADFLALVGDMLRKKKVADYVLS